MDDSNLFNTNKHTLTLSKESAPGKTDFGINNENGQATSENEAETTILSLSALSQMDAEALINQFRLDESIPVDLSSLLAYYNIELHETDFRFLENDTRLSDTIRKKGEVLGAVVVENDKLNILFRENDGIHRQRFTIAHELAHCCLDSTALSQTGHIEFRTDLDTKDKHSIEYKANVFAGKLLIPERALNIIYKRTPNPNLALLAKVFDVSVNVMQARLDYLKLPYRIVSTFGF